MGGKAVRLITGAVLIAAAFLYPGLTPLLQAGLLYAGGALVQSAMVPKLQVEQAVALRNEASTEAPVMVIYGSTVIGARIVEGRARGSNNQYLWFVGTLGHGSRDAGGIEAIEDVWFDERVGFNAAGALQLQF